MGNTSGAESKPSAPEPAPTPPQTEEKKKLKPCCACPETRKPRDECIVKYGEENCQDLIEAHKECLRKQGFKV